MVNKENAKQQIKELLEKYNKVVEEKRFSKYNEEMTKKDFILPLFRALGWNVEDSTEVTAEERISKGWVDYSFRINGIPKFFLEAKALKADLDNPEFAKQAISYAWHKGCTWAVLTDFDQGVRIFNAEFKTTDFRPITISRQDFLDKFEELWFLSKESFEQGVLDKEAEKWGKKSKRSPVGEQLLSDLTRWRGELSKDVLQRNMDKNLNEEDINEAVQRIIDRLIFVRNCEDRKLEPISLLSVTREWDSKQKGPLFEQITGVFKHFDKEYNSKLFEHHLCDDLDISNQVLEGIIKDLYHTKDRTIKYDFSALDADVLGNVYEQYLGHVLKKTAKRATLTEKYAYRKEQGIYYTPTYIVDYIVRNTLGDLLKNKKVKVEKIRVLDPACGSGSFLIKAFDVLNEFYSKRDGDHAQTQLDLATGLPFKQKEKILLNNIFGVDLDAKAVEIAQLNLLLKIAEKKQRLPLLQENIKCGNSLIEDEKVAGDKAFKWEQKFKQIMDEGGFDIVIGNPPYVRIQTLNKEEVEFFGKKYKKIGNYDIYVLFVEKALSLLKPNGRLGFILPHKFFTAKYGKPLRMLISTGKHLSEIVHFGDQQVFEGATTYTCLLFLNKKGVDSFRFVKVDDINKWRANREAKVEIISSKKVTDSEWNFTIGDYAKTYDKLRKIPKKLGDIAHIFVGTQTSADDVFVLDSCRPEGSHTIGMSKSLGKEVKIETLCTVPFLRGKEIRRYKSLKAKSCLICPYEILENKYRLYTVEELAKKFPLTLAYLEKNKSTLTARERGKFKGENWYAFGYPKSMVLFQNPKIVVPDYNNQASFTLDLGGHFYKTGYGIILKDDKLSPKYILGVLNSTLLFKYLCSIGTLLRGGYVRFWTKFIEQLPIRTIDFSSSADRRIHDDIVILVDKMLSLNKRLNELGDKKTDERYKIEEEIKKTGAEIDELVYKLYGITEEEKEIIEESLR